MKFFKFFLIIILSIMGNNVFAQDYRVMTYNIRYDNESDGINKWENRKESVIDLINNYDVDILGIQEGLYHQVLFLDEMLGNYNYIGVGRDDGIKKGEFSAIFYDSTQFSVADNSTFWLSENPDSVSIGWDAALNRICTYGLFQDRTTGDKFWVFNTHFDHRGKIARENSAGVIIKKIIEINTQNLPLIFMGDLNSVPESKQIKLINQYLNDAYLKSGTSPKGPIGTTTGFNKEAALDRRIDYIFVKGFGVTELYHLPDMRKDGNFISDHLPVFARIKRLSY